jgi:hypothetical protein
MRLFIFTQTCGCAAAALALKASAQIKVETRKPPPPIFREAALSPDRGGDKAREVQNSFRKQMQPSVYVA